MLAVITCVCALRLATALDIPLEGKSSTVDLTCVSKHSGGRVNFFFAFSVREKG